ncbi:putative sugar O-methyltransferase [Kribbella sp. NPDC051587]|uniref:putative sugar O-methyltransferase n=1 Tax=Kribbella sp. NPDC051587 TaxID=3364119 RepID=UPI0037A23FE9
MQHSAVFSQNDVLGNPKTYEFPGWGELSATTCRYIKVLSDIISWFPHLAEREDLRIAEIGGGYGGQAKILGTVLRIAEYSIIDLPEAGLLQSSYLKRLDPDFPVHPVSNEDVQLLSNIDLVISNYALSECRLPVARRYVDLVVNQASHGYMTCNYLSYKCPTREHFRRWITADLQLRDEDPLTNRRNYILTWATEPESMPRQQSQ